MGSLFDGIGVFPLAATLHGITPVWASEIVPAAISITKRHFPGMNHIGDIKPSAALCARIAAALQCSADTLFTDVLSGEHTENFIVSASERMLTDEVLRAVEEYLQRKK